MPQLKRPGSKTTKRPAKAKPPKKGALIRFTATQKVAARRKPKADSDGGVWLLIGPITWLQRKNGKINPKIKAAALKAFRKFKKG